jgi:hypothetical protein
LATEHGFQQLYLPNQNTATGKCVTLWNGLLSRNIPVWLPTLAETHVSDANPAQGVSGPSLFTHGTAWNYRTFVNANIQLQK